jgi:hypothetical protein
MTKQELENKAYLIATSNSMTKEFNYEDFQKCNIEDYVWEPYEYWTNEQIISHIVSIADSVIEQFEYLCD